MPQRSQNRSLKGAAGKEYIESEIISSDLDKPQKLMFKCTRISAVPRKIGIPDLKKKVFP